MGDGGLGKWGKSVPGRENSVPREWRRQQFMVDPRGVDSWGKLARAGELELEDPDWQPGELCRGQEARQREQSLHSFGKCC